MVCTCERFYLDGSPKNFFSSTEPETASNQVLSGPEKDQGSTLKLLDTTVDLGVTPENKSDMKSTAYATTKLAINLVKESSDVFPPLKSVAGGLSAILDHCDVRLVSFRPRRP